MLKADIDNDSAYSGEGSNTDSGRGPSEEGDKSMQASSKSSYVFKQHAY